MDMKYIDRYRLEREIGEGGYGKVWLASDTLTGEKVAVKLYKASFSDKSVEKAKREYELGSGLNHPNILALKDLVCQDGMLCLVMPYCPSGSIAGLSGIIDEEMIWKIVKDVASGMEYLHSRGILHLDIKPANILLDAAGNYVLADFGISQRISEYIHQDDAERTVLISQYMAPERINRTWSVNTYSDVWSFGVMLQELVSGSVSFLEKEERMCMSSPYLRELMIACTLEHPHLRPSASTILRVVEDVPVFVNAEPTCAIDKDNEFQDMDDEPQIIRCTNKGREVVLKFRYSGWIREYSKVIRDAMNRYKVVRNASNLYGIVDDAGNVVVDFAYDEILPFGECWIPGSGFGSLFIGAYFVQNDKIGGFRIQDDGSIVEDWKGTLEEYEERCSWT